MAEPKPQPIPIEAVKQNGLIPETQKPRGMSNKRRGNEVGTLRLLSETLMGEELLSTTPGAFVDPRQADTKWKDPNNPK